MGNINICSSIKNYKVYNGKQLIARYMAKKGIEKQFKGNNNK